MVLAIAGTDAPAIAGTDTAAGHCVTVKADGSSVVLGRAEVEGGTVCFRVSSTNPGISFTGGGSFVNMFKPKHEVTLARVFSDIRDEFSATPGHGCQGHP